MRGKLSTEERTAPRKSKGKENLKRGEKTFIKKKRHLREKGGGRSRVAKKKLVLEKKKGGKSQIGSGGRRHRLLTKSTFIPRREGSLEGRLVSRRSVAKRGQRPLHREDVVNKKPPEGRDEMRFVRKEGEGIFPACSSGKRARKGRENPD